jgi:glutathione S-transferase
LEIEHIKLYHFPFSRSARVKWLLHELIGDAFEVEVLALYQGQQFQPEPLRRNPNHAVPVLEITRADGSLFTMIESGAMIALLADIYPEHGLAPPATDFSPARADYLQMLHFGASWVDSILWQLRLHRDLFAESERDERTISRYLDKFATEIEPQLRTRFERDGYVAGASFTAADCIMGHNVMWAQMYGLCKDEVFAGYLDKVAARPAFQRGFADRDQFTRVPAR